MIQVTLTIPETVYHQAARDARRQARQVEEILAEFLRRQYFVTASDKRHALLAESEAFKQQHHQLQEMYDGQYIAMLDGKVVDHDADRVELSDRIYANYPEHTILIRRVEQQPERILHFRSPRLIRDA